MAEFTLTKRGAAYVVFIDDDDVERVLAKSWHVNVTSTGQPRVVHTGSRADGQRKVYLHRFILGTAAGVEVDHRNRNALDNRRSNLREVTHKQNMRNIGAHRDGKSGIRGAYLDVRRGAWTARVYADGRYHFNGCAHPTAEAAGRAAADLRKRLGLEAP